MEIHEITLMSNSDNKHEQYPKHTKTLIIKAISQDPT